MIVTAMALENPAISMRNFFTLSRPRTSRLVLAIVVMAALDGFVSDATAQQPGNILRITPGGAASDCLGVPTSPKCAAETLLACLARVDGALCRAVGVDLSRAGDRRGPATGASAAVEYMIDRITIIRPEDITEDQAGLDWFKPGFAMVEIQRRGCPIDGEACFEEPWEDFQVVLRPRGQRWEVVIWRVDTEPDLAPELPEKLDPAAPRG
jgi:hypothetical protein